MSNLPLDRSVRLRAMWCHLSGMFWISSNCFTFLSTLNPIFSGGANNGIYSHIAGTLITANIIFGLPFMFPLVFWLLNRKMHPFVDRVGRTTINYTAGVTVQFIVLFLLTIFITLMTCGVSNNLNDATTAFSTVGTIGAISIAIANIITSIFAAIYASQGWVYKHLMSISILKCED